MCVCVCVCVCVFVCLSVCLSVFVRVNSLQESRQFLAVTDIISNNANVYDVSESNHNNKETTNNLTDKLCAWELLLNMRCSNPSGSLGSA